jgi:putative inorganic carbon (hco3(-)) transporter
MIAFGLYLLLIVSYFLHLTARLPWLGAIRFDMVLMGLVLVSSFLERKQEGDRKDHSTKFLYAIILFIILSLPFVMWPGSVIRSGSLEFLKVVVFFFFTVSIVNSKGRLKIFIFVFLACASFRFFEPAYLHATAGYWGSSAYSFYDGKMQILKRLSGSPYDIINPNQLAWVIVSTVPFLYYLGWQGKHYLKILSAAVASVGVYALMLTGSRSGLLSLIFSVAAILFFGEKKFKRAAIGLMVLVPVAFFIAGELSPDLSTRYLSTFEGGLPGSASVEGRIRGLKRGIGTLGIRAPIGNGIGTSEETNANFMAGRAAKTHNLYLETVQEIGLIGLILFLMYVRGMYRNLRDAKSIAIDTLPGNHWLIALAKAVQVWIIMDLFYSLSCFGLNSWEWYLFGGISVALLRVTRKEEKIKREEKIKTKIQRQNQVLIPTAP